MTRSTCCAATATDNRRVRCAWGVALLLAATAIALHLSARPATGQADDDGAAFIEQIEAAHNADRYRAHAGVQCDMRVRFGGNLVFEGAVTFDTPVGKARIETADGVTAVFDGQRAWVSPADADFPKARFHLLTWPYFLATPFKLADPGANVAIHRNLPLRDRMLTTARLTFDPGTGDAPDDWYILYRDPQHHRLIAMAYIVTYGPTSVSEAEKEPHAITYDKFVTVDGVVLSNHWTFWHWSADTGIHGEPIGEVTISNLRFVQPADDAFTRPAGAREDKLPGQE